MAIGISGGAGLPGKGGLAKALARPAKPAPYNGAWHTGSFHSAASLLGPRPHPPTHTLTVATDAPKPPKPPTPPQPLAPAAPPAATTPPPASAPAPTGADGSIAPLDATALQNIAANTFKVNNQIDALNLQRGNEGTTLQAQLAQLAYQQPRDQLALEQRANQAGSLYSSAEGQNQGNLAYQFAGRQGGLQSNFDQSIARIAAEISALQGGIPLYNSEQALESAGRASALAAANPPGLVPPAPASAPAPTAPPGGNGVSAPGVVSAGGQQGMGQAEQQAKGGQPAKGRPAVGSLGGGGSALAKAIAKVQVKPTGKLKGGGKTPRRPI